MSANRAESLFKKRLVTWAQSTWAKIALGMFAGAVIHGRHVWTEMTKSCQEYTNSKDVASGVACVYDWMDALGRIAVTGYGAYTGAVNIANAFIGQPKHDNNGLGLAATLFDIGPEALTVLNDLSPLILDLALLGVSAGMTELLSMMEMRL